MITTTCQHPCDPDTSKGMEWWDVASIETETPDAPAVLAFIERTKKIHAEESEPFRIVQMEVLHP